VIDKEWRARFGILTAKLNISQSVEFRETTQILMPMVIGAFQPIVLIPFGLLTGFPVSQVEAILAHELAHIRRNDYLVNMLQSFIEVIYFFHPALWWVSEKVRTEREHCCDDIALTVCDDKMSLARALVKVAEWQSAPHLAMAFASKKPLLLQRISRVLGVTQKSDRLRANWPVIMILFTLLIGFSMYAVGQKKAIVKEKQVKRHVVKNVQTIPDIEGIDVEVPELIEVSSDPIINVHVNKVLREHSNDTLNKKMEEYQKKMDVFQAEMEPLQRRMEDLNLQMEKENFEMERYEREMEKLDWKKDKLMESREKLMEKQSALLHTDSKTNQPKLSESDLEKQLEEYEQQIKAQEQQITEFNSQIASVRKEAEAYKESESFKSIRKEIDEINKKIDDLGAKMGLTSFGLINYAPAPPAPARAPRAPAAPKMKGKVRLAAPPLPPKPNAVSVPKAAPLPPTPPKPPVKK
jgi:predicted  nucleic acid-binding Zn-ribbon protein